MNKLNLVSSYDYELPSELIANSPIMPKQNARLLVYERNTGKISHLKFANLADILSLIFAKTHKSLPLILIEIYLINFT